MLIKAIQSSSTPGMTKTSISTLLLYCPPSPFHLGALGTRVEKGRPGRRGKSPTGCCCSDYKAKHQSFDLFLTWTGSLLLTWVIIGRLRITGWRRFMNLHLEKRKHVICKKHKSGVFWFHLSSPLLSRTGKPPGRSKLLFCCEFIFPSSESRILKG